MLPPSFIRGGAYLQARNEARRLTAITVSNVAGIRQAAIFLPRDRLTGIGVDPGRVVVRRFILANLRDPALCLDGVAGAIGCSKRYLHKLFESEADTLNGYIWCKRLECVRRDFSDPAHGRRTITDIAFSWGFSSSSHFSRLVRDSFGVSPRRFRALASGAVEP